MPANLPDIPEEPSIDIQPAALAAEPEFVLYGNTVHWLGGKDASVTTPRKDATDATPDTDPAENDSDAGVFISL